MITSLASGLSSLHQPNATHPVSQTPKPIFFTWKQELEALNRLEKGSGEGKKYVIRHLDTLDSGECVAFVLKYAPGGDLLEYIRK